MNNTISVLKRPAYLLCTIGGMLVGYGVISFSIHASLIISLLTSSHFLGVIPAVVHIILWGTYAVGGWITVITSIITSFLWGVVIALSIYYMRHAKTIRVIASSGIRGVIALVGGVLGAGCWTCGGVLLAPFISMIAGGISVTLLYIGGTVMTAISFGLLVYSIYKLDRAIGRLG